MSTNPWEPAEEGTSSVNDTASINDTAAFMRFYLGDTPKPRSLLYRMLVGWWRDRD